LSAEIDDKLRDAHRQLKAAVIHVTPELVADPDLAQAMLDTRKVLHQVFDNHLFLFSPDGRVIAESPFLPGRRGLALSFRDYIQDTVAGGQPLISDPYRSSQAHNRPVLMFTAPVFRQDGSLLAILTGSLDLMGRNWFGRLVDRKVGEEGYLFLSTLDRVLIMHPTRERVFEQVFPSGRRMPRCAP